MEPQTASQLRNARVNMLAEILSFHTSIKNSSLAEHSDVLNDSQSYFYRPPFFSRVPPPLFFIFCLFSDVSVTTTSLLPSSCPRYFTPLIIFGPFTDFGGLSLCCKPAPSPLQPIRAPFYAYTRLLGLHRTSRYFCCR